MMTSSRNEIFIHPTMRKSVKILLKVLGVLVISFPFVASGFERISQPGSTASSQTNQAITNSNTPYTPSTYVGQSKKLLENALDSSNPEQTAIYLDEALTAVNEGLLFYKDVADLYATRGEIYTALEGSVDDALVFALHDFGKAFELSPQELGFARRAATIAKSAGEFDRAIVLLGQVHMSAPDNPEILLELAQAQEKGGFIQDAIASYTDLIKLLPPADTQTIRAERDTLVQLAAANLFDATVSGVQASRITAIGGFDSETITPPDDQAIPESITIKPSKDTNSYQTITNSAALTGTAVIESGSSQVTVWHSLITNDIPVYVTATSDAQNQILYVASKTNGSFVVAVDEEAVNDISFKWWIAN